MHNDPFLELYTHNEPILQENLFPKVNHTMTNPVSWETAKTQLPAPYWENHDSVIACYWKAWELAWRNLHSVQPDTGFVAAFIDTAFNGCIFLWDSVFILEYGRYARSVFDFQQTLNNFYANQHIDGFISREINWSTGQEKFHRHDPVATGPNVLAWSEWNHYLTTGDIERLRNVFPALVAYHRWTRAYRTWPDGSYWSTGLGCGMDNQPRAKGSSLYHCHMSWIDANIQALLSARSLCTIAKVIDRTDIVRDMENEISWLYEYIHSKMWNNDIGFYVDRCKDGSLSSMVGIGGLWPLLDDQLPKKHLEQMVTFIQDTKHFNRPHMLPSLSASHADYKPNGNYWCGSVWPPTTCMVIRGLHKQGMDQLAHTIALNHILMVTSVFESTNTVWENYSAETASPGTPAKKDFTGWGGVGPIALFFESVLGLRPNIPEQKLIWDCRLTEAHGVKQYPFGAKGTLSLFAQRRNSTTEEPIVQIQSTIPLTVEIHWENGTKLIEVTNE